MPAMNITQEITAKRPMEHRIDEIRPIQTLVTEVLARKSQQKTSAGFQSETQPTTVI